MSYGRDDPLWSTLSEALQPIAHLEGESEIRRLEKRIREYFRKAAKGIDFASGPWQVLINEYADAVFGSLFQGLGERAWLAQADFLLVLDAGVRELFPPEVIRDVPQHDFERAVLAAHDRAFEEQRFLPMLWGAVRELVETTAGPKAKKKVYDAAAAGRRAAMPGCASVGDPNQVKAFVSKWVDTAVLQLSRSMHGDPSSALPEAIAVQVFHSLLNAGALPIPLVVEHGPPPRGWPFVDYVVHLAYAAHDEAEMWAAERRAKGQENGKGRTDRGKGYIFKSLPVQVENGKEKSDGVTGCIFKSLPSQATVITGAESCKVAPTWAKEEKEEEEREEAPLPLALPPASQSRGLACATATLPKSPPASQSLSPGGAAATSAPASGALATVAFRKVATPGALGGTSLVPPKAPAQPHYLGLLPIVPPRLHVVRNALSEGDAPPPLKRWKGPG